MTVFTSVATGNWTTAGTWDQASSYPQAGDTAVIANTHTVTLDAAAACTTLTINSGGTLTTSASNYSLTTTNACNVSGTLTLNGSTVSCTGQGTANGNSIDTAGTGVVTGGTGANHTYGSIGVYGVGASFTLTTGNTTINNVSGVYANLALDINASNTLTAPTNSTVTFTRAGVQLIGSQSNTARQLYNLTINNASCALSHYAGKSFALTVANNLTITAGSFSTWDGTTSASLTVTGLTSVTGTLTCNASTISLNSGGTGAICSLIINAGGTFNGGSGTHTMGSLQIDTATSTYIASSGTTTINGRQSGGTSALVRSGATFTHSSGTFDFTWAGGLQALEDYTANLTFYNLTITKGLVFYTTSADKEVIIANNLTVANGADLDLQSGTQPKINLTITGDLDVNGTFTAGTSTVTFNKVGTSICAMNGQSFYNLNCSGSTQVNVTEACGILSGGAVTPTTSGSFVPSSGIAITFA